MNRSVWLFALALLLPLPIGGQGIGPAMAQDEVIKDCADCPELVLLPDGSSIGKYLVTRDQFAVFANDTGFSGKGCTQRYHNKWGLNPDADWTAPGFEQAGDHPVVCMSWLDATAYAEWLSGKTGKPYRLPTVEESSAAAAAESPGPYVWGADKDAVCEVGNVADASYLAAFPDDDRAILSCDDGYAYTSPVTAFPPNAYGLYDGIGNAWQWTNSCLQGDCANAIFRGGGWNVSAMRYFEATESFGDRIALRNFILGFRVLRDPE